MINFNLEKSLAKQGGYALLVTSLVILLGISITVFITARSMRLAVLEQRNNYNMELAFQAAEAGLEYGIAFLNENKSTITSDANNDGVIDGSADPSLNNSAFFNGTTYSIHFTNTVVSDPTVIQVYSSGTADNGGFIKNISQLVSVFPLVPTPPPAGMVVKSNLFLGGDASVSNTTITNSNGITLWSGGDVALTGSASTTGANGASSDRNSLESDVVSNDAGLSSLSGDQFFAGFFGNTKANIQENVDVVYNYNENTNIGTVLDGVLGQAVWVNQTGGVARFSGNVTVGSAARPVVLIVNGPLNISGNVTFNGMIYVIGDWNNSGGGNLTVNGAMVVEGEAQSTGTPNIVFSPEILANLGILGSYVKVPGSWKDF